MSTALLVLALLSGGPPQHPDPALSPSEVVGIVLRALQHNDDPHPNAGIETTFAFTSPANREETGPLERFALLVKNPAYRTMLDFRSVHRDAINVVGMRARQRVVIIGRSGERATYMFLLSKQRDEPYLNCWMTDGVIRQEDPEPPPGTTAT